jgi:hypothetical protein
VEDQKIVLRPRNATNIMLDEDLDLLQALQDANVIVTDDEESCPSDVDDYQPMLQHENEDDIIRNERQSIATRLEEITNGFTLAEDRDLVKEIRDHGDDLKLNWNHLKANCDCLNNWDFVEDSVDSNNINSLELFDMLLFPDFWNIITVETNRYMLQKIEQKDPNADIKRTNVQEMKCFIAILIRLSIVKNSSIRDYWKDELQLKYVNSVFPKTDFYYC